MAQNGGARPGAGRKPGVPNKQAIEIADKLAKLKCDPILGMAKIAANPKASLELRGKMYSELAQYVAPKRKAVEHSAGAGAVVMGMVAIPPKDR